MGTQFDSFPIQAKNIEDHVKQAEEARDDSIALQRTVLLGEITASRALTMDDWGRMVFKTGSGDVVLTIPPDSEVDFPLGAVFVIGHDGTDTLTIEPANGVTLVTTGLVPLTAGMTVALVKRAPDRWVAQGDTL